MSVTLLMERETPLVLQGLVAPWRINTWASSSSHCLSSLVMNKRIVLISHSFFFDLLLRGFLLADDSSAYIYILCVCVRVCSEDTLKPWGRCVLQFICIHTVHIHTYIRMYMYLCMYVFCVCVRIGDVYARMYMCVLWGGCRCCRCLRRSGNVNGSRRELWPF